MTWEQLKAAFSTNVERSYDRARAGLDAALRRRPDEVRRRVAGTLSALKAAGAHLRRAAALLPARPEGREEADRVVRYAEMKALYDALLAGLGVNAVQLDAEAEIEAGFIPASVVLTIGALGLTAAGVAWAVAVYEYAAGLRDQSAFLVKELDARQEAMRTGRALPAATGTAPPQDPGDPGKGGFGWVWAMLGVSALAAAAVFGPQLVKGR